MSLKNNDGNGHGTHTAATAAGTTYGVAPLANVIAIKVLSDGGSGSVSVERKTSLLGVLT